MHDYADNKTNYDFIFFTGIKSNTKYLKYMKYSP